MSLRTLIAALVASIAAAYPMSDELIKRGEITASQLAESYDYIIVGGGQAGIVIGSRLSEDPNVSVLVVEYGYFNNDRSYLEPASGTMGRRTYQYNITSVPQRYLNGFTQGVFGAACVGGGSTINGMLLNRGSAADYNAWEQVGNPGWGWKGLQPYFLKALGFDAPPESSVQAYGMTWNDSSYGKDAPIRLSMSPFQWPGALVQFKGMVEAGNPAPKCSAGKGKSPGDAYGVNWYPTALDNRTATRSYAVSGYYNPNSGRRNFNVLTGFRVDEVLFNADKHATSVIMTDRATVGTTLTRPRLTIKAAKEIIISAGALHSPQVLQRSGIGPKALLEKANIPLLVDLPGVGSNLQDHAVSGVRFRYLSNIVPNPEESYNNASFAAWVDSEWRTNRAGPQRIATGNTGGLVSLPVIDPKGYQEIVEYYRSLDLEGILPEGYTAEQMAGYSKQREVLSAMMLREDNAWLELPLQASGSFSAVLIKGLSRGTVLIDPADKYAEPIVDYHTYQNPADVKMMVQIIRFVRKFHETPSMLALKPEETRPGANVTTDAQLVEHLRNATSCSTAHNSGTAVMMPRDLGGVVGPDLLVYGVTGLSVADSSIMPILIGAHTCSTVYAVAEKAADIIKARHLKV